MILFTNILLNTYCTVSYSKALGIEQKDRQTKTSAVMRITFLVGEKNHKKISKYNTH